LHEGKYNLPGIAETSLMARMEKLLTFNFVKQND